MTKITPLNAKGKSFYKDGNIYLQSKKENSVINLKANHQIRDKGGKVYIWIHFKNLTDKNQIIDLDQITVLRKSKKDKLDVISYNDLIKEVNKSKKTFKTFAVLGGFGSFLLTGVPHQRISSRKSYHSGKITDPSGKTYLYETESYNPNLAHLEYRNYIADINKHMRNYDNQKQVLKKTILKRNTLFPNDETSGLVAIRWPELETKKDYFTVKINFANDIHEFDFKQLLEEK